VTYNKTAFPPVRQALPPPTKACLCEQPRLPWPFPARGSISLFAPPQPHRNQEFQLPPLLTYKNRFPITIPRALYSPGLPRTIPLPTIRKSSSCFSSFSLNVAIARYPCKFLSSLLFVLPCVFFPFGPSLLLQFVVLPSPSPHLWTVLPPVNPNTAPGTYLFSFGNLGPPLSEQRRAPPPHNLWF